MCNSLIDYVMYDREYPVVQTTPCLSSKVRSYCFRCCLCFHVINSEAGYLLWVLPFLIKNNSINKYKTKDKVEGIEQDIGQEIW